MLWLCSTTFGIPLSFIGFSCSVVLNPTSHNPMHHTLKWELENFEMMLIPIYLRYDLKKFIIGQTGVMYVYLIYSSTDRD